MPPRPAMTPERQEQLARLQESLQYRFRELWLLNKALTHKSYVNENTEPLKNNERFEFLGDAVLDLMVSDYLVRTFEDYPEGRLSKIRAAVVNETCLAKLARKLNLGDYLLLGKGEILSGGRDKNSLLANAYEALVGAVYRDSSLETTVRVLMPHLEQEILNVRENSLFQDFKSQLQEMTQVKMGCIPSYRVVREQGPDHDKIFEVEVVFLKQTRGNGKGKSKKEAEQAAARQALLSLQRETGNPEAPPET